jgi:hypothetical protein
MVERSGPNRWRDNTDKLLTRVIYLVIVLMMLALLANLVQFTHPFQKKFPRVYTIQLSTYEAFVRSDMRSLSTALDAYHSTYGHFPVPREMKSISRRMLSSGADLSDVYTYPPWEDLQNQLPAGTFNTKFEMRPDPFTVGSDLPHGYYSVGDRYVLHSVGRDGEYSFRPKTDVNWDTPDWQLEQERIKYSHYQYDPTNGSHSAGDYIRFSDY